jgi:cytochrome c-type biogenesis protein CcmH
MLGRSLTVLGRQAEAIAAYRQALARLGTAAAPEAAGWRVDLADLLGSAKSGSLAGEPAELVAQALAQDDRHPKALALAGAAAWQAGEHEQARRYWRRLLEVTPADEPLRRIAEQGLAQP